MVITSSRLAAVRYYHEVKRYIEEQKYNDVQVLVAFRVLCRTVMRSIPS